MDQKIFQGFWHIIEAYAPDGSLMWIKKIHNLVPTVGHNYILDTLHAQTLYVGLKGSGSAAAADTMSSHSGWSEVTGYSQGTRPELQMGTAASGAIDNSSNKATFTINASVNVAGIFVTTDSTKSGSSGTLLSVSDFDGVAALTSGSTLNVTVTHESSDA